MTTPLFIALISIIGLLVGSFLNVVIYRLPIMLQRSWRKDSIDYLIEHLKNVVLYGLPIYWRKDCIEYLQQMEAEEQGEPFNLSLPLSRCPKCQSPIKAYQNIPIISYIFLKGQCANCKNPISCRYPLIEAFTAIASVLVALHFGYTPQAGFALLLTWCLIALSFIDIDHQLLPDNITLPLLWLGLLLSLFGLYTPVEASVIGAAAGYLVLWLVYQGFKLATGKEGMGYGDFKLLAMFGAWLGWQALPMIILLSSLVGAIIGVGMIIFAKHDSNTTIPFGPYLAAAGWIALLWGNDINQLYLTSVGL